MYSVHDLLAEGLPHSDVLGSKPARGSPRLFAACHVLLRLLVPRHPPNALRSLNILRNPIQTTRLAPLRHRNACGSARFRLRAYALRHRDERTNLTTICRAIAISLTHHAQEPIIGKLIRIAANNLAVSR